MSLSCKDKRRKGLGGGGEAGYASVHNFKFQAICIMHLSMVCPTIPLPRKTKGYQGGKSWT
ncbi:MAG: hypothetical protein MJE68_15760 [Proteobacteria bacterium]|nr:hypothetical protein [Pseudomonadota bacterium]